MYALVVTRIQKDDWSRADETCALRVSTQRLDVLGIVADQIRTTRLKNVQGGVVLFVARGAANAVAFAIGHASREVDVSLLARARMRCWFFDLIWWQANEWHTIGV